MIICLLTVFTQVGGLVYLLSILTHKLTDKWTSNNYLKATYRFTSFVALYCLTTFLIVPLIANPLGRIQLPLTETNHLQPLNILTCLLNRNDGKKLDFSFCYRDYKTGESTNECPSFIGCGICEEALPDEKNTADFCVGKGFLLYTFMTKVIAQDNKQDFTLDIEKTRELVNLFSTQPAIGNIFIEPHLKTRLNLTSDKIRFHGCQAVRHDDHIHVQLK